jgi:hypothetical protein
MRLRRTFTLRCPHCDATFSFISEVSAAAALQRHLGECAAITPAESRSADFNFNDRRFLRSIRIDPDR